MKNGVPKSFLIGGRTLIMNSIRELQISAVLLADKERSSIGIFLIYGGELLKGWRQQLKPTNSALPARS